MAKAMKTIRESVHYPPQYAEYFAANQSLFNRVVAFYFKVIQAHEGVLDLPTKEALTALEKLTHATEKNPSPVLPLTEIAEAIPAFFRRAAINAAIGSARSFSSSRKRMAKTQREARSQDPPQRDKEEGIQRAPARSPSFLEQVGSLVCRDVERAKGLIHLAQSVDWPCWSWVKVRTFGRDLPEGFEMQSPVLVRRGAQWWLHTSMEKTFSSPPKIAEHLTNTETRICAVDLNLDQHVAVCTVQTVAGTILATRFIGEGRAISGTRRETVRTDRTSPITDWHSRRERTGQCRLAARKIRHMDEHVAHLVSARIVQFACEQGACILVFEHLGNLRPEKGKYSHRGNSKRARHG